MLKLIKDLDDPDLTWIVVSDKTRGKWSTTIEKALESHTFHVHNRDYRGEDPNIQLNIETVAEGDSLNELKLEMLLNE
ncbi:hypothetical protein HYP06_gp086 [Vibrio phage vB_VspP_pVa5]|uniref:Uncharacterized protein n=1 Tax=Vibrio phage vB_VspP_pVa5 TaxID=1913109 RepID=A0A1J0GVA2_9CAUD|nr:hypothetical protein HYP06_gp086 [Vibrio phage vB_VspP_pVa5]APC46099.1 hypothetical protein vBVspPpVa5_0087 [Vibrio phage vB_VspP_pVa5]